MTPEDRMLWRLTDQRRWAAAVTAARERLIRDPESAYAFQTLAMSLPFLSQLDEAWVASNEACRLAPEDPWNFIVRSRVAIAQRRGSEAVLAARRAVELGPAIEAAHVQLAEAYLTHLDSRGTRHFKPAGALSPAREALRLAPTSPWALSAHAHALKATNQRREAIRAYRAVLEVDPNRASALTSLGILYGPRQPWKAVRSVTASLTLQPHEGVAQSSLGWLLYGWTRRMIWTWLVVGALLAVTEAWIPTWLALAVVVTLALLCIAGTGALVRGFPRGSLRGVWAQRYPTRTAIGLLGVAVLAATTAACASMPLAVAAFALLLGVH